jgi:hypothetical protein
MHPGFFVQQMSGSVPPLIEINPPSKFVLDSVYFNGLHALRRFEIRNLSKHSLIVKLRSNLGQQLAFQLSNENLPDRQFTKDASSTSLDSQTAGTPVDEDYTTNTLAACSMNPGTQFNQLFNYVGHLEQVLLDPLQSIKVILSFLPSSSGRFWVGASLFCWFVGS